LYVDDMARASIHLMNIDKKIYTENTPPMCSHVNVGSGKDLTIKELAETIKEIVGFNGEIYFDSTKPDGSPRKLLDSELISNRGFKLKTSLKEGLKKTYQNYIKFNANI
jgi:GDP-L-fucose synthase